MRCRALCCVVLTLLVVGLLGGVAHGITADETGVYTTAEDCYTCHQGSGPAVSKVEFSAELGAVDLNACRQCHGDPFAGIGIYEPPTGEFPNGAPHIHYGDQCAACHDGDYGPILPDGAPVYGPSGVPTQYGCFLSYASPYQSPAAVHAAHQGAAWVDTEFGAWRADCVPCHAQATCSVCHTGAVPHGTHGDALTCTASGCHSMATATTPPSCAGCHTSKLSVHGYDSIDHVAADASADGAACSACHDLDLATAHGDAGAAGASCATCHPSPRDTAGAWDQACATGGCHTVGSAAPMHADADVAHSVPASGTVCLGCHEGTDLGSIHAAASDPDTGATACFVCHTGSTGEPFTGDCTSCHFTFDAHYDATAHVSSWAPLVACSGSGCHTASGDLMAVHTERDPSFTCSGCHDAFRVAGQIEQGLTGCGDCHDGVTQTSGHRAVHGAQPALADSAGAPAYSYYTGSAGSAPTSDCVGCHTSNLIDEHLGLYLGGWVVFPRYDASGAALTCDTCHSAGSPDVTAAIAAGLSSCESCHDVHGPIALVHAAAPDSTSGVDCAGCHDARLDQEHAGVVTTTPGGRTVTGCALCHSYYDGERGALIEAAIGASGQTACGTCHGATHPDLGSHEATDGASAACLGCHGDGAVTDVRVLHAGAGAGACAVCHDNAGRVGDIAALSASCASCHAAEEVTYHRSMAPAHTSTASQACVDCHESADIRIVHADAAAGACAVCHDAPDGRIEWATVTAECAVCHVTLVPVETAHYPVSTHLASAETGCNRCHYMDMNAEHSRPNMAVTCVTCHEVKVDGLATWDKTCAACHPTKHGERQSKHASATVGCSGTGCHILTDAAAVHAGLTGGGCGACHVSPEKPATTTDCRACHSGHELREPMSTCASSGCHSVSDVHGVGAHRATVCTTCHGASAPGCDASGCHSQTEIHTESPHVNAGCAKCHISGISKPHQTVTSRLSTDSTWKTVCGSCHGSTHSSSCLRCHGTGRSENVHLESAHMRNTYCGRCHVIASADAGLNCVQCHPKGTKLLVSGGDASTDPATVGGLVGTVTAGGAPIAGATVSVGTVSEVTDSAGRYSMAGLTPGTVTVTAAAVGYATGSQQVSIIAGDAVTADFQLAASSTNLARGRAATASSYDGDSIPARAVDGSIATYWRSRGGGTQWLRVDLGSARTIDKAVVRWYESRYARSFRIETSLDGASWTTQYATSNGAYGTTTVTFAPVGARYVRLYCLTPNDSNYRVLEFEAWGF